MATFRGDLVTSNGNGSGQIETSFKYDVSSQTWVEVEVGTGNGAYVSGKVFRNLSSHTFLTLEGKFIVLGLGVMVMFMVWVGVRFKAKGYEVGFTLGGKFIVLGLGVMVMVRVGVMK